MEVKVKSLAFGETKGETIVYFHGAPGAIEEAKIFKPYAVTHDLYIICFERAAIDTTVNSEAYFQEIANQIVKKIGRRQVRFVGFSIGCHVAIEVSLILKNQVRSLDLISAAAPLEAGDFLAKMAGKTVFLLAQNYPFIFKLLSYWQKLLFQINPKTLFLLLFASAVAEDQALRSKKAFYLWVIEMLGNSFGANIKGYIRDVSNYVEPWREKLAHCDVETHIWHGKADNWSPLTMAYYLDKAMPNVSSVNVFEDKSHYSCLYQAVPSICKRFFYGDLVTKQVVNSN